MFERLGNWLFKTRNVVLPVLLLVLLFGIPPRPFRGNVTADRWLDAAGCPPQGLPELTRLLERPNDRTDPSRPPADDDSPARAIESPRFAVLMR